MPRRKRRCDSCGNPIRFLRRPGDGKVVPFEDATYDATHLLAGVQVFPVYGLATWRPAALAEHLQGLHELTEPEAERQVRDMQWARMHLCRTETGGGPDA